MTSLVGLLALAVIATPSGAFTLLRELRVSNVGSDGDAGPDAFASDSAYNSRLNQYLVVWDANPPGPQREIFGQRLSSSGKELGPDFRISTTGADGDPNREATQPEVVYNRRANQYLVLWRGDPLGANNEFEIFGQRLSATGAELGGDFRISNTGGDGDTRSADSPVVAVGPNGQYLVVWSADGLATDDDFELFGQRFSPQGGELGPEFIISTTPPEGDTSRDPSGAVLVFNPVAKQYLVVWAADGLLMDEEFELFGQRLSTSGAELGTDFRITTTGVDGDPMTNAGSPSLALNSRTGGYLMTWGTSGVVLGAKTEIFGQRFSSGVTPLGPVFRISHTDPVTDEDRTANGSDLAYLPGTDRYLVVWGGDGVGTDNEFEISGQRLSSSGAELGGDFRISTTGGDGDTMRGASDAQVSANHFGSAFLTTWRSDALPTDNEFEIFGRIDGEKARCGGRNATGIGGPRRDVIEGTPKRDVIAAKGGNDLVRGLKGNDLICGGRGKDKLLGGKGKDNLRGDRGRDRCVGGPRPDRVNGCEREASV